MSVSEVDGPLGVHMRSLMEGLESIIDCPLSGEPIGCAYVLSCGHSFGDRGMLESQINKREKCPFGCSLVNKNIVVNHFANDLYTQLVEMIRKNAELKLEKEAIAEESRTLVNSLIETSAKDLKDAKRICSELATNEKAELALLRCEKRLFESQIKIKEGVLRVFMDKSQTFRRKCWALESELRRAQVEIERLRGKPS